MFILTTLVAIACSWYAYEMRAAAKRRRAIAELAELGGIVGYYDPSNPDAFGDPPGWLSWLRILHGDEQLGNAVAVHSVYTRFPDAGLVHIIDLDNLEKLNLMGTQISGDGLVHLRGLEKLEHLNLMDTQITDSGLVHLEGLTRLKVLDLNSTQITDSGLVHLRHLTNLEELHLTQTETTSAGMVHLEGLANLKYLEIQNWRVNRESVDKLQKSLPNCEIHR